jgi:TadE-like protein
VRAGTNPRAVRLCRALRSESGTATVEFCMVFPIVLFLVLILVQSTLLMVGNQFVQYAAFAATRSAIVYIPADYGNYGEPRNTIVTAQGSPKFDAIRAAAYLAVMPVSGSLQESSQTLRTDDFVAGLRDHFASYSQDAPRWVQTLAADRLRYAAENTVVEVMQTVVTGQDVDYYPISSGGAYTFEPRDAITVRIEHRLNLSVPYIRAIFADGEQPDGRGKYALVTAHYTLTNEGVNPDLPAVPQLERITQ